MGMAFVKNENKVVFSTEKVELEKRIEKEERLQEMREDFALECARLEDSLYWY